MEKSEIEGRSMPLNILAILLNLTGVVFVVLGYHESWEESAGLFKIIGFTAVIGSLIMMLLFKGFNLMSYVSRVLIGGLFIVSGLIKANDPLGFSYKLEEYFEDGALAYRLKEMGWESFSLEGFMEYAVIISIIVCIAEIVLGVAVIIGSKMKLAFWSLVVMMGFFTLLTWHTKSCDTDAFYTHVEEYSNDATSCDVGSLNMYKARIADQDTTVRIVDNGTTSKVIEQRPVQCVNDCGCFGDALKGSVGRSLTPAESFWKDLVLLYLVIFIGISMCRIQNNTVKENVILVPLSMLVIGFFSWVFGWYFPLLFALIVILLPLMMKRMQSKFLNSDWSRAVLVAIASGLFVLYVIYYLPAKDYRAYAVGQSIPENMISKEDPIYKSVMVYKNSGSGEEKSFTMEDSMQYSKDGSSKWVKTWQVVMDFEKDKWTFLDTKNELVDPGEPATIVDFKPDISFSDLPPFMMNPVMSDSLNSNKALYYNSYMICKPKDPVAYTDSVLVSDFDASSYPDSTYSVSGPIEVKNDENNKVDIRPYLFSEENLIMVVMKTLLPRTEINDDCEEETHNNGAPNEGEVQGLKVFLEGLSDQYNVVIFTASSQVDIDVFKSKYGLENYFFTNSVDDKELKVVVRASPGIVAVNKGTVKGKWSIHNRPTNEELDKIIE